MIEPKNIPLDVDYDEEPWDLIRSTEVIQETSPDSINNSLKNQQHHYAKRPGNNNNFPQPSTGGSKVLSAMSQLGGAVNQYPLTLNSKINTAGIFNTVSLLNRLDLETI